MGLKDAILNKMLGKMMKGIVMDVLSRKAKSGRYDINGVKSMLQKLIGKEASEKMIREIEKKVSRGEKVGMSMIMDLMKNVDISKIKEQVEDGEISAGELQSTLNGLVGKEQTKRIFKSANSVAKKIINEEQDD